MMVAEVVKFTFEAGPVDEDELWRRHLLYESVTEIRIAGIAAGDRMARRRPRLSERIFEQVERLRNLPSPMDDEQLKAQFQIASDVAQKISEICSSDQ
jgi:hypothetical protein